MIRMQYTVVSVVIAAVVTTPTLKQYRPTVVDNKNGTVKVSYRPTEAGTHTLEMNYADVPLQGSPYKFTVQQVTPGKVSVFGPGLSSGLAGQPSSFTVVTKDAGPGIYCNIIQNVIICSFNKVKIVTKKVS